MEIKKRYHLYEYLPDDMKKDVTDVIVKIKELREKFEAWGKEQDEVTQGLIGLKPIPGQRVNVPDRLAAQLFTKVLMPQMIGMPGWCKDGAEEGYHAAIGAIFNSGAFCYFYGDDPDSKENPPATLVLLQQRKESRSIADKMSGAARAEKGYVKGALGGFMKKGEESSMTVIREALFEELPPYEGKTLFKIDEKRMVLVHEGRDYESQRPPLQYSAYAYKLNRQEMIDIKNALADPAYVANCHEHSGGETTDIILAPLDDVLHTGSRSFRYSRQYDVLQEIGSRLRGRPQGSPLGYTLGDSEVDLYRARTFYNSEKTDGPVNTR